MPKNIKDILSYQLFDKMPQVSQTPIPPELRGGIGKRYTKNQYEAEADRLQAEVLKKYQKYGDKYNSYRISIIDDKEAMAKLDKIRQLRTQSQILETLGRKLDPSGKMLRFE